jgi:hypothetical protein
VAVAPVPPEGAHEYVYGPTPPEAVTVAVPFVLPQVAGVVAVVAVTAVGCVMVNILVIEHPAGELIVQV